MCERDWQRNLTKVAEAETPLMLIVAAHKLMSATGWKQTCVRSDLEIT